jgi:hypothetical protein
MGALFSGGSGRSRGEARRRRRAWRALDGPEPPEVLTNMRSRARRSAGVGSSRRPRGFSAFHEYRLWFSNPSILGRAFLCDLVDSQNKLTFGRRVLKRPHPDSAFAGGRLGRASPLFASAFLAKQPIGSPTRIDRGRSDLGRFGEKLCASRVLQLALAALFSTAPSITTPASTHRHNATSSLRASATAIFFFCSLLASLVRSPNQRASAEPG